MSDQRFNQDANYYRKEWMTDDQWKSAQLLSEAFGGFHNMKPFKECGNGVSVILRQRDLSTYDFNHLTSLVIMAHKHCIRVSICLAGMYLEARAYARKPDGKNLYERHPSLEQLKESIIAEMKVKA